MSALHSIKHIIFPHANRDLGVAVGGITGPVFPALSLYNEDDTGKSLTLLFASSFFSPHAPFHPFPLVILLSFLSSPYPINFLSISFHHISSNMLYHPTTSTHSISPPQSPSLPRELHTPPDPRPTRPSPFPPLCTPCTQAWEQEQQGEHQG